MRITWAVGLSMLVLAALVFAARWRLAPAPAEMDGPVRPSLHAVPAEDFIRLNAGGAPRVPPEFERVVVPGGKPGIVIFLKADCPCSLDFAKAFGALAPHLAPAASFLAVLEANQESAGAFARDSGLATPLVADDQGRLATAWGITKAGAMALVGADGRVEALWPGVSRQVVRDLETRLGRRGTVPEVIMTQWPGATTAGCPLGTGIRPPPSGASR